VAWTRPLDAPHPRLTLTLPALLATRELVLPLIGPAKLRVYQQARLSEDDDLPISLVLHQHQTPVRVWLA
jgi:6-phosphogluconolactonase